MYLQLIECPSVYELIASPHFDWSEPPELRLWRKLAEEETENEKLEAKLEAFGPGENLHVMMAALEKNKVQTILRNRTFIFIWFCCTDPTVNSNASTLFDNVRVWDVFSAEL